MSDTDTNMLIRGRKVVGGYAEGEAMVTTQTISGWGGINETDGSIIERRHELVGQSFAGKILIFPGAKGSSGWSAFFHMTRINGVAPAAMLFTRMTTKIALGAVVTRVPAMTDFDQDILSEIRTGDHVIVNADDGFIKVLRR
ncbi:MAG: aconitase X swivel domain-containing protein [Paracoccaceae bacterium]